MWRRIADAALLGHEKRQMDTGWCRVVQESLRVCVVPPSQSLGPRLGLRVGNWHAGGRLPMRRECGRWGHITELFWISAVLLLGRSFVGQ